MANNLFGGPAASAPAPQQAQFDSAKLYVWVKGLESKVNNLLREVDLLKNDFIKRNNQLKKDMKTVMDDVIETKHEQEKILQKMDLIINELKQTAGKEEVMTINKYLEFWNPLNFVTHRDLEKVVENKIAQLKMTTLKEETKPKKKKSR
ncbi:MAG: hypothetical protein KKA62_03170 [Nanoarchaeota archaeon]|nr:hypothetical protein [Nanoarchaeota archaeon]MBU1643731.1 hypothetical protein [Nanoarchaeota archaeon]MBU1976927.1 hypothetical protein [Nanoarchaeota archaeon]